MNRILCLASCVAALFLVGCASSVQYVRLPDLSKKIDDPTKGRIYVMRPSSMGTAVGMNVSDGGNPIGSTGPAGFLCWERDPGDVIVSSNGENTSRVSLAVRPGNSYYVLQHLRMGIWMARTELEVVSEEQGELELKKCHPAKFEKQ